MQTLQLPTLSVKSEQSGTQLLILFCLVILGTCIGTAITGLFFEKRQAKRRKIIIDDKGLAWGEIAELEDGNPTVANGFREVLDNVLLQQAHLQSTFDAYIFEPTKTTESKEPEIIEPEIVETETKQLDDARTILAETAELPHEGGTDTTSHDEPK